MALWAWDIVVSGRRLPWDRGAGREEKKSERKEKRKKKARRAEAGEPGDAGGLRAASRVRGPRPRARSGGPVML